MNDVKKSSWEEAKRVFANVDLRTKPEIKESPDRQLTKFMSAICVKRLLVINIVPENRKHVIRFLEKYAVNHGLEYSHLKINELTTEEDIRGETEGVWIDGELCSKPIHPSYWPKEKGIVVVEGVNSDTSPEVIEALVSVAGRGVTFNDKIIDSSKLPEGSAFVLLAGDDFPMDDFQDFGVRWKSESAVMTEIKDWKKFWEPESD